VEEGTGLNGVGNVDGSELLADRAEGRGRSISDPADIRVASIMRRALCLSSNIASSSSGGVIGICKGSEAPSAGASGFIASSRVILEVDGIAISKVGSSGTCETVFELEVRLESRLDRSFDRKLRDLVLMLDELAEASATGCKAETSGRIGVMDEELASGDTIDATGSLGVAERSEGDEMNARCCLSEVC